jgi:hypothetical protein
VLGTGMLSWAATMFCWDARSGLVLGLLLSVVDPESFSPDPDPTLQQHVFGPPGSGSISQRYGSAGPPPCSAGMPGQTYASCSLLWIRII